MSDLVSRLRSMGLEKKFEALGLDFEALFAMPPGTDRDPYEGYEWVVKKTGSFGTVINAVPPDERMGDLPWDEWFVLEGTRHHHVLYLEPPERYDEVFVAPEADDIHPPRTLGKRWYVIEDPDMTPALLRSRR